MAAHEITPWDWPGAYRALLAECDLDAGTVLSGALQPAPDPQPALFSLAQMLEAPGLLIAQLDRAAATGYEPPHPSQQRRRIATLSVLHQDLALRIIAPLALRLFRDGTTPALDPNRVFLTHLAQGRPDGQWRHAIDPELSLKTADFVSQLARQMCDWYPVFRRHYGVSPGAYWSSVGLALGAPFSAVWNRVDPTALCRLATAWLNQFNCDANRYIDWIPARFNNQPCALPQRRGCCLNYLLPNGGYCGTCGIYRRERMGNAFHPL
ncbi:MAG TPA: (2Fe-2S)-binding protein [Marinobacter sp.]|nr:(2Fe-2S)-binding protein [Marinobacter sp.]